MKRIFILSLIFFQPVLIYCQSITNSTGGSVFIDNVVHEFSIGEMVLINTAELENIICTQGLLQPDDFVSNGNNSFNDENVEISVFPTLSKDYFNLKFELSVNSRVNIFVTDLTSQTLVKREIEITNGYLNEEINLGNLTNGIYFINIYLLDLRLNKSFRVLLLK